MTEFFTWRLTVHSLVTVLLIFCVIAQATATILSHYRRPYSRVRILENLLEILILFHIIILSMLQGQAINAKNISILYSIGYDGLRYIAITTVILIVLFACIIFVYIKKAQILPVIAFVFLTFPAVEAAVGGIFAWLYIAALFLWLLRGIHVCFLRYREIRTGISYLSVKDTIDSMFTGVVFSILSGNILLYNSRMSELMTILTGEIHRNANRFYETLISGELRDGCSRAEYNGQVVCRLPDRSIWIFVKTELRIRNRTYIQLSSDDVTKRWVLTEQLQQQENQLILRSDKLKDTIENLHILSREKELHNTKLRAHDILGGWLTMLLHAIRNEQDLDIDMLRSQSQSLMHKLKTGQSAASPREKFDNLQRSFETIGVEIHLEGDLPGDNTLSQGIDLSQDEIKGYLLVDIIGESVVNAVRHGFATCISIQVERSDDDWHLEVTDNGRPLIQSIVEGGGIGGMRRKLKPHGGTLKVITDPRFILAVDLPGGEIND